MAHIWENLSATNRLDLLMGIDASHSLSQRTFEELPGWVKDLMKLKLTQKLN